MTSPYLSKFIKIRIGALAAAAQRRSFSKNANFLRLLTNDISRLGLHLEESSNDELELAVLKLKEYLQDASSSSWTSHDQMAHQAIIQKPPYCHDLIESLSQTALKRFPSSSQSLSSTFIADLLFVCGLAQKQETYVFQDAAIALLRDQAKKLKLCTPLQLSTIVWSYAQLGFYHRSLLEGILNEISHRQLLFSTPSLLTRIVWGFAMVGADDFTKELWKRVLPTFTRILSDPNHIFTLEDYSKCLWSLAVGDVELSKEQASLLCQRAIHLYTQPETTADQLARVYLWWLHLTTFMKFNGHSLEWIKLLMKSRGAMQVCTACSSNVHKLTIAVGKSLQGRFVANHICPNTGFHVDFVDEEERIVLDCLGSSHYVIMCHLEKTSDRFSLSGQSRLKGRLLRELGKWKVVNIPYYKWIRKQKSDRQEFIFREIERELPGK
jgi:hypothetical protein